jgi:hypothetical protein
VLAGEAENVDAAGQLDDLRRPVAGDEHRVEPLEGDGGDALGAAHRDPQRLLEVLRDPHIGTGVSKSGFVDWGKLSLQQVRRDHPDAVVVFIGANEGFDMPGPNGRSVKCCGPDWAAVYAFRARRMMNTYRRRGAARVYWLTLPLPRDGARREVAKAVNAAIDVASVPYRSSVRVLDMAPVFTPAGRYRDAMTVGGRRQIVREGDGIHLNGTGAGLAAGAVLLAIDRDFGSG